VGKIPNQQSAALSTRTFQPLKVLRNPELIATWQRQENHHGLNINAVNRVRSQLAGHFDLIVTLFADQEIRTRSTPPSGKIPIHRSMTMATPR
jgi:hypothetical protein